MPFSWIFFKSMVWKIPDCKFMENVVRQLSHRSNWNCKMQILVPFSERGKHQNHPEFVRENQQIEKKWCITRACYVKYCRTLISDWIYVLSITDYGNENSKLHWSIERLKFLFSIAMWNNWHFNSRFSKCFTRAWYGKYWKILLAY